MVRLALLVQFLDLGRNPGRLVGITGAGIMRDLHIGAPVCIQILFQPVAVVADNAVGTVQDRCSRTVVLIQHDGLRAREILLKVQDDIDIGPAPGIDGLVRVADNIEAVVNAGQLPDQFVLHLVNILELIDMDPVIAPLPLVQHFAVRLEHLHHPQNQVIKIQREQGLLTLHIVLVDLSF